MSLLGIDVGTTHLKVGLFAENGKALRIITRAMILGKLALPYQYFDPITVWDRVVDMLNEIDRWMSANPETATPIGAIGITSMAETGLLVDRESGDPLTPLIPWFDPLASARAEELRRNFDVRERFLKSGIRLSAKPSLLKILWLRDHENEKIRNAVWLSTADYIAYKLCGQMATDYSLAGRTYGFRIDEKIWDHDWLRILHLPDDLFPPASISGSVIGEVIAHSHDLPSNILHTPVANSGHDHICASFAVGLLMGGFDSQSLCDSIGTAESLLGIIPSRKLGQKELESGLSFGCHALPGMMYWMGGIPAAGGSVEWLRKILNAASLTYEDLDLLVQELSPAPGEILYFPYLNGSGTPHPDSTVRGAFVGLSSSHGIADLYQSILEGVSYEAEYIRQTAELIAGNPINLLLSTGGGIRNRRWMQIRADVTGCQVLALSQPEMALLGAALLSGIGAGVYPSIEDAANSLTREEVQSYFPNPVRHRLYQLKYESGYLQLQEPLRRFFADQVR